MTDQPQHTDQPQPTAKQHTFTEAPASWNIRYRVNGFDEQITLRGDTYAEIKPSIDKAREYVRGIVKADPLPKAAADAINTDRETASQVSPTATQTPAAPQNGNGQTFACTEMSAVVNAGKVRWIVKGGQFTKFGVTCWPEVLAKTGVKFDPTEVYNMAGWTATYTLKEDGKPDKIINMAKAS